MQLVKKVGYSNGNISLTAGKIIYIYVGSSGSTSSAGWNGGGNGGIDAGAGQNGGGGRWCY